MFVIRADSLMTLQTSQSTKIKQKKHVIKILLSKTLQHNPNLNCKKTFRQRPTKAFR